jgi:hypothetical protein
VAHFDCATLQLWIVVWMGLYLGDACRMSSAAVCSGRKVSCSRLCLYMFQRVSCASLKTQGESICICFSVCPAPV